jgi:hypothetical protein
MPEPPSPDGVEQAFMPAFQACKNAGFSRRGLRLFGDDTLEFSLMGW